MNDKNYNQEKLKHIYNEVSTMEYSENNFLDLINYIQKATLITKKENPNIETNDFLYQIELTKEKQLDSMYRNYANDKERKNSFDELKFNFLADFMWNNI